MSKPGLLISGFTRFSDFPSNPSQEILEEIKKRGLGELDFETLLLTVDEEGSKKISEMVSSGFLFSAILHLGFSSKSDKIRLERQGKNLFNMEIRDNSGREIKNQKINEDSIDILKSTADLHCIGDILRDFAGRFIWSDDAGGFICNETYFRTLEAIAETKIPSCPVLFIHLPDFEKIDFESQFDLVSLIAMNISGSN